MGSLSVAVIWAFSLAITNLGDIPRWNYRFRCVHGHKQSGRLWGLCPEASGGPQQTRHIHRQKGPKDFWRGRRGLGQQNVQLCAPHEKKAHRTTKQNGKFLYPVWLVQPEQILRKILYGRAWHRSVKALGLNGCLVFLLHRTRSALLSKFHPVGLR